MILETVPFDSAEFVDTPESQAELLADAIESGDARYIAAALGTIVRARGMTIVAREAGVTRETLYRALSEEGDPRLTALLGVGRAPRPEVDLRPRGRRPAPRRFGGFRES